MVDCAICGKPIQGVEVFGPHAAPACWDCYSEHYGEAEPYYGLAPHHHDLSITGSYVGSTVIDSTDMTDEFTPDPDAPGLGIHHPRKARGWQ